MWNDTPLAILAIGCVFWDELFCREPLAIFSSDYINKIIAWFNIITEGNFSE